MKTYKNLYNKVYSLENLELAFKKAKKRKSSKGYVIEFEEDLDKELQKLHYKLKTLTYKPKPLKRFVVRDPKTRTIHASVFRDRVVYHALVNILEPIFEKIFIYDSYASRKHKGTHNALLRFDKFKRKVSKNYQLVNNAHDNNQIKGHCFKADIKHYFKSIDHEILIKIIKRKIKDEKVMWLIKQILSNFDTIIKGKGMPLGNLTSQFFANVYLTELDYFIKHKLKAKYYLRYVDDFVILHNDKRILEIYREKITKYLKNLKIELHPDKSNIAPLRDGVTFVGYKIFSQYKLLRKRNLKHFKKKFKIKLREYKNKFLNYENLIKSLQGWFGYAMWANTYKLRKDIIRKINIISNHEDYNANMSKLFL